MAPRKATKSKATTEDAVDDVQEKNDEKSDKGASKGAKMVDKKADKKPKKKLDKVTKPRKRSTNPTVAEMVKIALIALKSRQGCTLSGIRNYITKNYEGEMTKQRQNLIKKFLSEEFQNGRLKMTNDDKPDIDFSKRFKFVNQEMEE